jgi:hypothetical protein
MILDLFSGRDGITAVLMGTVLYGLTTATKTNHSRFQFTLKRVRCMRVYWYRGKNQTKAYKESP